MSVQSRIKSNQRGTAVTAVTGAAPQTVAGNAFPMFSAEPFTVSALAYTKATVNTLTLTGKWQGRNIASGTWLDVYTANSAANVAQVTGTGSAVTATRSIAAPRALYSVMEARYLITSGVGSGSGLGSDEASVAYNYRTALYQLRPIVSAKTTGATAVAVTGASGSVIAGPTMIMGDVQPGTLMVLVYAQATTNTLTLTGKWQVSETGTAAGTWYDAPLANNAANSIIVTGTGSAVSSTRFVEAPDSVYGWKFARYSLVTGGTTASTGDEYSMSYQHLRPFA
jgi:hypothetical protein